MECGKEIDLGKFKNWAIQEILSKSNRKEIEEEITSTLNFMEKVFELRNDRDHAKLISYAVEEIKRLKAKLAKYESEEVVVFPRIPTQEILDALESGIYWDYADTTFDPNESYKAMIEVGEIK